MGCIHLHIVRGCDHLCNGSRPTCNLLFRVNHFIRTIAQRNFPEHHAQPWISPVRSQSSEGKLFQENSESFLQWLQNRYRNFLFQGNVKNSAIGTVTNLRIGQQMVSAFIYFSPHPVNCHNFMSQLIQLLSNMSSKSSKSNKQYIFHNYIFSFLIQLLFSPEAVLHFPCFFLKAPHKSESDHLHAPNTSV